VEGGAVLDSAAGNRDRRLGRCTATATVPATVPGSAATTTACWQRILVQVDDADYRGNGQHEQEPRNG
jgi:hypothetical protein